MDQWRDEPGREDRKGKEKAGAAEQPAAAARRQPPPAPPRRPARFPAPPVDQGQPLPADRRPGAPSPDDGEGPAEPPPAPRRGVRVNLPPRNATTAPVVPDWRPRPAGTGDQPPPRPTTPAPVHAAPPAAGSGGHRPVPPPRPKPAPARAAAPPDDDAARLRELWATRRRRKQKAEIKAVLGAYGGQLGGPGAREFEQNQVYVDSAGPLDSPTEIDALLDTDETLRARGIPVTGSETTFHLRYRRHGRVRSSRYDLSALTRYTLVDLTCTVTFSRCVYFVPAIGEYLVTPPKDLQYYGVTDLRVAGMRLHRKAHLLATLGLAFTTEIDVSVPQQVRIHWHSRKVMNVHDGAARLHTGSFLLDAQTTNLTAGDERTKKYFTITRQTA